VSDSTLDVTDASFEQDVFKSDLPVMLDMWAPWCGPCRMVTPVIEELGSENAGKVRACKMNVEDSPETAGKFGITAIPTVMFFADGKEKQDLRMLGVQPKEVYQRAIDQVLGG
jgi:thioredoxin 1